MYKKWNRGSGRPNGSELISSRVEVMLTSLHTPRWRDAVRRDEEINLSPPARLCADTGTKVSHGSQSVGPSLCSRLEIFQYLRDVLSWNVIRIPSLYLWWHHGGQIQTPCQPLSDTDALQAFTWRQCKPIGVKWSIRNNPPGVWCHFLEIVKPTQVGRVKPTQDMQPGDRCSGLSVSRSVNELFWDT